MKTREELPECPVATTVQLIGSKWKLLILRNLLARPWRFNELRKSLEGISQKVLTDSLRSMEEDGIITRTVYPEVPFSFVHKKKAAIQLPLFRDLCIPFSVFTYREENNLSLHFLATVDKELWVAGQDIILQV